MANKIPALGLLVRKLQKSPMTRKQMTTFLLKQSGRTYQVGINHDYFNSNLYGTRNRLGILELFAYQLVDGSWMVPSNADTSGPFNPMSTNKNSFNRVKKVKSNSHRHSTVN